MCILFVTCHSVHDLWLPLRFTFCFLIFMYLEDRERQTQRELFHPVVHSPPTRDSWAQAKDTAWNLVRVAEAKHVKCPLSALRLDMNLSTPLWSLGLPCSILSAVPKACPFHFSDGEFVSPCCSGEMLGNSNPAHVLVPCLWRTELLSFSLSLWCSCAYSEKATWVCFCRTPTRSALVSSVWFQKPNVK